ncbi:DUF4333 domain-containing protein [Mycobacterium sp. IDR2000157661]|uniref:DUF4333 domain-containing protein n=1 Tax=Mycobacterium sp. IDR2000157661 TaxID=2867005 RepID=UPI001EEB3A6B|nr:DUF4333 domain-containing protein [Mycobacterium sp. IDR2000157661]ULE32298.1 DUF4333 domain-containing protein [Mycobacterium sp. IDR2000157661]
MVTGQLIRMALVSSAAAVMVGCSSGTPTVDREDLAGEINKRLEQQVGRAPDSVTCPQNLRGEVGNTERCELKDGDDTYGVTVTVTKVEGTDVSFDFKVDDRPQ